MEGKEKDDASELHIVVPRSTEGTIEELFANGDGQDGGSDFASMLSIEQRRLLFFDELLAIYVVLHTAYQDEAPLKLYLARLSVALEARAYGSSPRTSATQETSTESSPSRNEDVIWTGEVDTTEEPVIIIQGDQEHEHERSVIAIWRTEALLSRPRIRLVSPTIAFKAAATLNPVQETIGDTLKDGWLPSGIPESMNLLQPLQGDPVSRGVEPRLSASRLYRVQPFNSQPHTRGRALKVEAPSPFPALPAISSRARYHRSNNRAFKSSIVSSLEFDTSPFSQEDVEITKVDMQLSEGSVEDLAGSFGPQLPLRCRPKDSTVYLYRLIPNILLSEASTSSLTRMASIAIDAVVLVSEDCRPRIQMRWKTGVDFSTALNPTYGTPGPSMQRSKRPASLPVISSGANNSNPSTAREGDRAPEVQTRQRAISVSDLGVTMTFTTPKVVQVNKTFTWDILVLNGSSKPRRILITPIPKRKRGDHRSHLSKPSSSSTGGREEANTAEAIIDENMLYAIQKNARMEPSHVVSLSADVRIGPLNPGSCLNAELKFVALRKGHHQIECVQVVDVISNDSVEIRDLPDIVVEESLDV